MYRKNEGADSEHRMKTGKLFVLSGPSGVGKGTLREHARRLGKNPEVVYQKAARGGFQTAVKMGRDWFIDSEEPYTDNRIKSGKYVKRIK